MLGHRDIQTTMRYALFVPDHALRSIRKAQRHEVQELATALARVDKRVKNG